MVGRGCAGAVDVVEVDAVLDEEAGDGYVAAVEGAGEEFPDDW